MSSGWSWFVILLTLLNIAACWWLLWVNSRSRRGEPGKNETMGHVWDGDLREYNQPLPLWWLMLFYITIVVAIGYLVLYPGLGNFRGTLAWTQVGQYENELTQARNRYGEIYDRLAQLSVEALAQDPQALEIGHRLFVNNCSVCHGSDGRGAPGFPNLTDDDWLYGATPAAIEASVLNGRNGVMPPLGAVMSDADIDNTVAFVRQLSGQAHDPAASARGATRFAALCAACHGADGAGNQLLGAPNLTDNIWLYGGTAADIRNGIVNGRNNRMPAQKDLLGTERARLVSAYVYRLAQPDHAQ